mgnify:FL=1
MINEIDKALAEQGDKIDANQKQQAEQLKTELKTALDNNDMTTLEAKMSELEQMAQQMASYAYQQQQDRTYLSASLRHNDRYAVRQAPR